MTERADQIAYWESVRADQVQQGAATDFGPDDVAVGNWVQYGRNWYRVVRVNRRSVSVQSLYVPGRSSTLPYPKIRAVRVEAAAAAAES